MTEIQKVIQDALARYRAICRKRAWLAFLGTLALAMAAAAVLDRYWMFSGGMRWLGWMAGLVLGMWAARRAAGPVCPDASTLAHRVEAKAEESAPVVATAIDPAVRATAGQEPLSRALLERLDLRAEEAVRLAPPTFRGLLRGTACLVGAAVVALTAVVTWHGGQALRRMVLPWEPSPYTKLVLEGPADPVAEGRAFTLTARVSGVPVDKIVLYRERGIEPLAEAVPDGTGRASLAVDGLDAPADFVARGGDGQSEPLRIEPYALPEIEAFEIAVTPPGYAEHAADIKTFPSFTVFRGSRLRYRVRLKAPAVSIAFERSATPRREEWVTPDERHTLERGWYGMFVGNEEASGEEPGAPVFRPDPEDPAVWEAAWDLPEPGDIVYRLAIEGGHGDRVRNEEPWRINVLVDAAPRIRIDGHNGNEVIQFGDETVRLDLSAVDDVRLEMVRLVYRKPGQPHTARQFELPPETRRTWTGTELLELAPLDLDPLDIVAVHAEAEDGNLVDGPGVGRSEIVFLEVPLPESANDGSGGGGGGGGGGPPPVNPLELQMEILRSTMGLPDDAPPIEQEAIAGDQEQNAEYTGMIEEAVSGAGLEALGTALRRARIAMESAAEQLNKRPALEAVPDEEKALGYLIEASQLLDEAAKSGQLASAECEAGGMTFTLRPPRGQGSESEKGEEDGDKEREALSDLMEEVRRQLAEQEALNQQSGQPGERADQQQSLAQDARSAANTARNIPASSDRRGDPRAAAEELERAAGLQEDNAEALAGGDDPARADLGTESAKALKEALRELAAQLEAGTYDTEAHPPGYERLVNDYLRSISYE